MRIKYFDNTDTALLEFSDRPPVETRALDENIYLAWTPRGASSA